MDPADGESSSQKENSVASQRKILKASHSKHGSEKKEQQRHSEQTISNGRTVTIHFDQLDVIRVLGEGNLGVKLVSYKYFQELSAKLSSLWIAMIRRSLLQ